MNALLFTDVAFDSDESWAAFQLMHGMAHQTAYQRILEKDTLKIVPTYYPMYDFPRERNSDYLLDHWQVHVSNAAILGLPGVPDLATVDFESESQFSDWLGQHALVHANENAALGIL